MDSFTFEKVSLEDAKRVHDGVPSTKSSLDGPLDGHHNRARINNDEPLRPETAQWLLALPATVRPHKLAQRYPRVANRICALWGQPRQCSDYLDELLLVRRPVPRQGFPSEVAKDIAGLTAYYLKLHPVTSARTRMQ